MDDEALIAEFNDDPSPASQALIDIVVRVHARYVALFAASGMVARFKREVRVKGYVADGWRGYVRALEAPRVAPAGATADAIEALLAEFEREADPLLFNNLVLAQEVARGAEPDVTVETEADRLTVALAALAAGAMDRASFVASFGHHSLAPYELSEPRYHEMDEPTLAKIAAMAPRWTGPSKRNLDEILAGRDAADVGVLIAIRELARSRALRIVDDLRARLLHAANEARIDEVFEQPVAETLARLRQDAARARPSDA